MSLADTAKLLASLDLDNRKFNAAVDKSTGKLHSLGTKGIAIGSAIGVGLERLAEAGIRKVAGAITGGIDSLATLEDATTSLDGAIKQVGKGWTITGQQIADQAVTIESSVQSAFDDKDIAQAAQTLIRYGDISQAQLFPAMQIMTDLAARTGSVASASDALAKSLADPTKAARLLRTAGVSLTKDQQKQIKAWVDGGQKAKAQAFILDLVAKKTKGAAAAMHGPLVDAQLELHDAVEEAQKALAIGLLPVLTEVRQELTNFLSKPENIQKIKDFGTGLADGFRQVVSFVKKIPWDQVAGAVGGIVGFAKSVGSAFLGLPAEAKGLILGLAALNKLSGGAVINVGVDLLKGAGGTLFQQFLGKGSPANPMFVVPVGGGLGGGAVPVAGAAAGGLSTVGALGVAGLVVAAALIVGPEVRKFALEQGWAGSGPTAGMSQSQQAHFNAVGPPKMDPAALKALNDIDDRTGQVRDRMADVSELTRRNLQELPAAISAKQAAKFDAIRTSAETNRIALVSAVKDSRPIVTVNVRASITAGSVSRARIVAATYSAGHLGATAGVGAHVPGD